MSHVLVAYTDDEPGVLNRVASLFRRRGFNIHSFTGSPTGASDLSRMTIVVDADEAGARKAQAHLEKLLNVQKVEFLSGRDSVVRDLALIRVSADPTTRSQVLQLAQTFRARVVDMASDSLILECTGTSDKLDALTEILRPFGLLEQGRSGAVALARGGFDLPVRPA